MKNILTTLLLNLVFVIGYSQDIIPPHTYNDFHLKGKVSEISQKGFDYVAGEAVFKVFEIANYRFSNNGNLYNFKSTYYDKETTVTDLYYSYDEAGNMVRSYDKDPVIGGTEEVFRYDSKGNVDIILEIAKAYKKVYNTSSKLIYNANNLPVIREESLKGELFRVTNYTYDNYNKLTSQVTKSVDGELLASYSYTYHPSGEIKSITYTTKDGTLVTEFEYNSNGLETRLKRSDGYTVETEYLEYDSYGNWLKSRRKSYFEHDKENILISVVYREIIFRDGTINGSTSKNSIDVLYNFIGIDLSKATILKAKGDDIALKITEFDGKYDLRSVVVANGSHLLVYDRNSRAGYMAIGYKEAAENTNLPYKYLGRDAVKYAKSESGGYWIYYKGEVAKELTSVWLGDDLLVYSAYKKRTFLLPNYKNAKTEVLLDAKDITNLDNCYYTRSDSTFKIIEKGKIVSGGMESFYLGDDIIAYQPDNFTYYQLPDYTNAKHDVLHYAPVQITSSNYVCIKINASGGFRVYKAGKNVSGVSGEFDGNDLLIAIPMFTNYVYARMYLYAQVGNLIKLESTTRKIK